MKETLIILKKELLEIIRDKSTLLIILVPFMIFPIFNIGMEYLNKNSETDINICIICNSEEASIILNQFAEKNSVFNIKNIDSNTPEALLKTGDIDCYVKATEYSIDFIYNSTSFNSLSLTTKLGEAFQEYYNSLLSESYHNIFKLKLTDENGNMANPSDSISTIFIPIILVILIFQGTSSFSNDIFAGEKERKTLELLLLSGVKKQAIYCGKSFSLVILSVLNLLISLGSYFISFNFTTGLCKFNFMQNENVFINIFFITILLFTLSLISVFLSVTVSMLSKNIKNAQILNELILTIPVGFTALLALGILKDNIIIFKYIPVLNLLINFNNVFLGNINIGDIVITLISNFFLIVLLIVESIRYMKSEKFIS